MKRKYANRIPGEYTQEYVNNDYFTGYACYTKLKDIDKPLVVNNGLYDLCIMEYYDGLGINAQGKLEKYYAKCRFTLNERGFISQISNCECTYNSEGYLTGVKTFVDWWTFAYNNGDVAKAMVEVFKSGNMDLYYVYYGEKKNEGELYITCKELEYTGFKFHRSVMAMIAYHAGLFGNISKHCTTLPNTADAKTFIELSSWNSSKRKSEDMTLSCKFTFSD